MSDACRCLLQGRPGDPGDDGTPGIPGRIGPPGKTVSPYLLLLSLLQCTIPTNIHVLAKHVSVLSMK